MGAVFAFLQSPAELSKKAPSIKIRMLSIFIENSYKYLLKSITWIPIQILTNHGYFKDYAIRYHTY